MKLKILCGALLGLALGMGIQTGADYRAGQTVASGWFGLGISGAEARPVRRAARRTTRRVARRTTRRVARRTSIAGCSVWRAGYWNCGGVYYRGVVQGGTTVYVVVNP